MNKIIKFSLLLGAAFFLFSCEKEETNFDLLTNKPSSEAYYVQLKNDPSLIQSSISAEDGSIVDIETTLTAMLLGEPQSQDVIVNIIRDDTSTLTDAMFEMTPQSIVIPAGKTSAKLTIKTNTDLMEQNKLYKLVLSADAGDKNAPTGTTVTYNFERPEFCLKTIEDYVGSWSGTDSWGNPSQVVTTLVDGDLYMNGIGFAWFTGWWGETITTNNPVKVNLNLYSGEFTISVDDQTAPYIESTYEGNPQTPYYLSANGKLTSTCEQKLEFEYVYVQGGSEINGTAWGAKTQFKETIQIN